MTWWEVCRSEGRIPCCWWWECCVVIKMNVRFISGFLYYSLSLTGMIKVPTYRSAECINVEESPSLNPSFPFQCNANEREMKWALCHCASLIYPHFYPDYYCLYIERNQGTCTSGNQSWFPLPLHTFGFFQRVVGSTCVVVVFMTNYH